jgi:hypothetical protein
MLGSMRQFGILSFARWWRLLLPLVLLSLGLSSVTAEAGIMTTMSADSVASSFSDGGDQQSAPNQVLPLFVRLMQQHLGVLEMPQNSSGATSSSTSSFGSSHSFVAVVDTVLIGGLACSGWIVPESAQALPPLLPSGLFRPPCA